uniref:NADH dehydrogenase subunit 9 n=1 Tax=Lotharella oceanica TaxID=641309 RepID=A0A140GYS0_9EUKA|nr:NADH dehydrogenase subunit 9 [Lotharella oceanica]AMN87092.1 NADH dehydrogenase subunit 9 [Lotharella oceanica]
MLLDNFSKWLNNVLFPVCYGSRAQGWDLVLRVKAEDVVRVLMFLQSSSGSSFTVIDRPSSKNRFSLVYNLLGIKYPCRISLRLTVSEGAEAVPVFARADWMEREAWDLFGVFFIGDPEKDRFYGRPLRKDFPLTEFSESCYLRVRWVCSRI